MSYILDALKKSEQQRQHDAAPAVQSLQRPGVTRSQRRGSVWLPIVLAVVLGNALLFAGIWWLQTPKGVVEKGVTPEVSAPVAQASVPLTQASDPAKQSPAVIPTAVVETPTTPPAAKSRVQELWEIPDPVRARLPALTYSFHVYSSDPERRTIIINDKRMREGSAIADNLVLESITEDGVVLGFEGYRIQVKVLEGW